MKKFLLIFVISVLSIFSCKKDSENLVSLTVSPSGTINVQNTQSEEIIDVITNCNKWTAITSANWITINQEKNKIKLQISKNLKATSRSTEVIVIAGNQVEKLLIKQVACETVFEAFPNILEINNWKKSYTIDINSNSANWTVEDVNLDWIKIIPKIHSKEILVEVEENTDILKREATIVITESKNNLKKIRIIQDGRPYYILPIMDILANEDTINKFELSRKSSKEISYGTLREPNKPVYKTKSEVFPKIQYIFSDNGVLKEAVLLASDVSVVKSLEYQQSLKDAGFEATEESGIIKKTLTSNDGLKFSISAVIITGSKSGVKFTYTPEQPKSMPTLKHLTLGYTNFNNVSKDALINFETQNNGVYTESESGPIYDDHNILTSHLYWFKFNNHPDSIILRYYVLGADNKSFNEGCQMYSNVELFYYSVNNTYYMTKEFSNLLAQEGYVKFSQTQEGYIIYIGNNGVAIAVKVRKYNKINEGRPVVDLRFVDANEMTSYYTPSIFFN